MDLKENNNCDLDDEIFFGRLTLKEVKKRIFMDVHHKYKSLSGHNRKRFNDFKIIETSSEPNILLQSDKDRMAVEHLKSISDPVFNRNTESMQLKISYIPQLERQDSFLEIEKNVTEQCSNLDNTLEFVDFILNHAHSQGNKNNEFTNVVLQVRESSEDSREDRSNLNKSLDQLNINNDKKSNKEFNNAENNNLNLEPIHTPMTPIKCDHIDTSSISNNINLQGPNTLNTPIDDKNGVLNLFKTPKIPHSGRKDASAKKTPRGLKTYQHIASPIATYIRNSPQVPLVKDVHPKKPLPNISLIPKFCKNAPESKSDKENIVLPQVAYRNAKKTLVIDVNKEKLPQGHLAQKLTGLARKPVVLKHNHRETDKKPLPLQQEDSFQDLTLHQADISVCTQKLAFNKL